MTNVKYHHHECKPALLCFCYALERRDALEKFVNHVTQYSNDPQLVEDAKEVMRKPEIRKPTV